MTPSAPGVESLENPLESLVGYRLRQVSLAIAADLSERLEALSLTLISLSVLLTIEANPGVTQSDLCRRLGIKRANMTPQVFQFERRKLIERLAADGRSQSLRLTAKGKALSTSARDLVQANESAFLSALSAADQTALEAALARLNLWRLSSSKVAS